MQRSPATSQADIGGSTHWPLEQFQIPALRHARQQGLRTGQGRTYPVCIELLSSSRERGLERKPGSAADSAIIWTTGRANPVDRFE